MTAQVKYIPDTFAFLGARWLDTHIVDWYKDIDIDALNAYDNGVLVQLAARLGTTEEALLEQWKLTPTRYSINVDNAYTRGFRVPTHIYMQEWYIGKVFKTLTEMWRREINDRLEGREPRYD